jgi:hypothetical protein
LQCQPDTAQDLADRLMRHAIDAFGANGFHDPNSPKQSTHPLPQRLMLGPEASRARRSLLKYLKLSWDWPTLKVAASRDGRRNCLAVLLVGVTTESLTKRVSRPFPVGCSTLPSSVVGSTGNLLTGTALLCFMCSQLTPVTSALGLANWRLGRAKMGAGGIGT